jgi:hypothetical protein
MEHQRQLDTETEPDDGPELERQDPRDLDDNEEEAR